MQTSLLTYLEDANLLDPNRAIYVDGDEVMTVGLMFEASRRLASVLCKRVEAKSGIMVLAEKSIWTPVYYFAILYAGCYYVPLGADLPKPRLDGIVGAVDVSILLSEKQSMDIARGLDFAGEIICAEDYLTDAPIDDAELNNRRSVMLDIDPAYVLFTSGTSGVPKGIVTPHRAVIDYIDVTCRTFGIGNHDILGSQAPFDYVAAIRDIYLPLKSGAKTVLIPKSLFSMPGKLLRFIDEMAVTTLCWVAPALALCSELNALGVAPLRSVNKVIFTGSALAGKHLRAWQQKLPEATFINHYGPTEITASCTYYIVPDAVGEDFVLPIGVPFENTGILLIGEDDQPVSPGEVGEICVSGAGLALGYYRDPGRTAMAFVQNPLQPIYPERIYRTGDLGSLMPDGNYAFHGRMDMQIKHMGHRIELSEIETAAQSLCSVLDCCCLYQQEKEQIWLFYVADCDNRALAVHLRERLPAFMVPRKFVKLEAFPRAFNGKLDLGALRGMM